MSLDTAPCGCLIHADNEELCRYPELKAELEKLKKVNDELRQLIKRAEYSAEEGDVCPWCRGRSWTIYGKAGHKSDCPAFKAEDVVRL